MTKSPRTTAKNGDNVISFPGETAADVEVAAARWLSRMTSGDATAADRVEFAMWRMASPDHDRVFSDLTRIWTSVQVAAPRRARVFAFLDRVGKSQPAWSSWAAAAAATIFGLVFLSQAVSGGRFDYATRPGQIKTVHLADGSVVNLNGDTALNVRFAANGERRVELSRGEAFFEVHHDPARPFTVDTGAALVRDIGTGFDVARRGERGSVSVDHGEVEVLAADRSTILDKGQQVQFGLYDLGRKTFVDTSMASAWRRGLYFAENDTLGDVMRDLNAYYPGRIVLLDHGLADRRINAVVQLAHIDAWLAALNKIGGVSVRKIGPLVVIDKAKA
jgi:transmembrane sensor